MSLAAKPTVWITRTAPAAFESAAVWAKAGYAAAVAPVLEISKPDIMPAPPARSGVIIFTSGNAINAFAQHSPARHWPVVTVGQQTKRIALDLGFKTVSAAKGSSESVTDHILEHYDRSQPIYHCAGNHVRGTITEDLKAAGYHAQRDLYYASAPVTAMPKLDTTQLDYAAIYSPLGAKTLASFNPDLSDAVLVSISKAVDDALGGLPSKARYIASEPKEAAMIEALTKAAMKNSDIPL